MRRWFAILMLVLLPAQLSWAAVGPYAAHAASAETAGSDHHSHAHAHGESAGSIDASAVDPDAPAGANDGAHADCEICHLACSAAVPVPLTLGLLPSPSALPSHAAALPGRHLADPPDRPQWHGSRAPV